MIARPSLLLLTAVAATVAAVANAVDATAPADPAKTRLGVAIDQDITVRDKATAKRERALDMREQATRAAEQRIKDEIETRDKAAAGPPGAGKAADPDDQYANLARIYQAMKPTAAAAVFEQLEMDVQMKVAQRMRERSTALILAAMTPKGAAALSMALARKRAATPPPHTIG